MQELDAPEHTLAQALSDLPAALMSGAVGVAVSGGSDSLGLALLTAAWAQRNRARLLVLTVDHGLRPESRAEADQVAARMEALGLDHHILRWDRPRPGAARARDARHALLAGAMAAAGGRLILTGHTADDQDETFLIRARQGSGWYGLAGMRPLSLSPAREGQGIWIARPLLGMRRETLRQWLRQRDEAWSDDPSNDDGRHERVRMRRLLASSPDLGPKVTRIRTALDGLRRIEDAALARWWRAHVAAAPGGGVAARFDGLPPERAGWALAGLIGVVTGRRMPLRAASLRPLAARVVSGEAFRGATLGGARLRKAGEKVIITKENGQKGQSDEAVDVVRRLLDVRALLTGAPEDFALASGKESFLQISKPILPADTLT